MPEIRDQSKNTRPKAESSEVKGSEIISQRSEATDLFLTSSVNILPDGHFFCFSYLVYFKISKRNHCNGLFWNLGHPGGISYAFHRAGKIARLRKKLHTSVFAKATP